MNLDISTFYKDWATEGLYFVIQAILAAGICSIIEKIRPIQDIPVINKEKIAELGLAAFNNIIFNPILHFALLFAFANSLEKILPYQIFGEQIQSFPYAIQIFLGLLLLDLKVYIRHRFTHEFMWQTHSVHHSAEDINWLTGWRLHPQELFVDMIFTIPFMHILGFSGDGISTAMMIFLIFNLYTHLNLNFEYPGILRYMLGSPNFHRWHHAKLEKEAYNKNYSVVFPFLDLMFGSFYYPKGKLPQQYGIKLPPDKPRVEHSLYAYLAYPFRN